MSVDSRCWSPNCRSRCCSHCGYSAAGCRHATGWRSECNQPGWPPSSPPSRRPGGNAGHVSAATWALGVGATAVAIAVLVLLGYRGKREHRAAMLGCATGTTFGLNSSLIAGVGATVAQGSSLWATWQTYGIALVGPISFFLLQNSLQAGRLVASQPGFTLLNPLVSVMWGLTVFGEHARGGWYWAGTTVGALLIIVGTVLLARSDLLDPDATDHRTGQRTPTRPNQ